MKRHKYLKIIALILASVLTVGVVAVLCLNGYVKNTAEKRLIPHEEAIKLTDVDCILVLGCGVRDDGTPSAMLGDRLKRGIALYQDGAAQKLLMSGDHGQEEYNEVGTMKAVATEAGIPSEDVFMDHAGFSTYESLYRAKEVFRADKIIIVSQSYHLYRALYIAEQLGIEAYGVSADYQEYSGQFYRDFREVFARCKDVFTTTFDVPPTYGGEAIPVSGNGDETND